MKKNYLLLFLLFTIALAPAQNLSLDFNNTTEQYVETSPMVPFSSSFTVMGWVYSRAAHTQFFTWGSATVNNYLQIKSGFNNTFQIYAPLGVVSLFSTTSIINAWHHVAVTNDSGTVKIYVDGVEESSTTADFSSITPTKTTFGSALLNGTIQGSGNFKMDEFSVWNVALSKSDIETYMDAPPSGSESGLVLAYDFNPPGAVAEGDNTSITSISNLTTSYDGTLTGFSLTGTSSNYVETDNATLSIGKSEANILSVVPNPASSSLTINGSFYFDNYSIYNALGKKVFSGSLQNSKSIDISALNQGIYILNLGENKNLKFVKN